MVIIIEKNALEIGTFSIGNWKSGACERAGLRVFILNRMVLKGFHDEVAFE